MRALRPTGMTPKEASRLRIVDPACGSGLVPASALPISAWIGTATGTWPTTPRSTPAGRTPVLYRDRAGQWSLTTAEKKRILLDNIYGVDIDPQAVEVTKLSLLLKILEGESAETLANQLRLFHERALPDLGGNIKCGNSLIGPDYYERPGRESCRRRRASADQRLRLEGGVSRGFGKAGGFDAVIGNPPYISIQTMNEVGPEQVRYFNTHYSAAGAGNYDIYVVFVEQALRSAPRARTYRLHPAEQVLRDGLRQAASWTHLGSDGVGRGGRFSSRADFSQRRRRTPVCCSFPVTPHRRLVTRLRLRRKRLAIPHPPAFRSTR